MIQYHVNKLAYSKRAITLAFFSCIIVFVFVWQGVESMTSELIDHKNTLVRLLILTFMLGITAIFAIYFWLYTNYQKMKVAVEYAKTVYESVEIEIRKEYEEAYSEAMAELSQLNESLEWEKKRYEQLIAKTNKRTGNETSIPIDYSMDRNRIVFVQQKGANGQTVYEYAYYEVLNNKLIIGKAGFKRKLYSTQDKRDSLNRMIGVEDIYTSDKITVYKQLELNINDIPEPYRTAIQFGSLKTETVLSLVKDWQPIPPPPTTQIQKPQPKLGGEEDAISLNLM